MTEREKKILTDRLIPVPQKIEFRDGADYIISNGCLVKIFVANDAGCRELADRHFRSYWQTIPEIVVCPDDYTPLDNEESYGIEINEKELKISAASSTGVFNAMKTLRQLAEVQRGTPETAGYFLVQCTIHDAPALAFRGIHLCIFPETPLWDIEKQLRIAAYHKFNYAVIEPWGVFPFEKHPDRSCSGGRTFLET